VPIVHVYLKPPSPKTFEPDPTQPWMLPRLRTLHKVATLLIHFLLTVWPIVSLISLALRLAYQHRPAPYRAWRRVAPTGMGQRLMVPRIPESLGQSHADWASMENPQPESMSPSRLASFLCRPVHCNNTIVPAETGRQQKEKEERKSWVAGAVTACRHGTTSGA
jgi:hypothetical protein